jgi:hypothetical protein
MGGIGGDQAIGDRGLEHRAEKDDHPVGRTGRQRQPGRPRFDLAAAQAHQTPAPERRQYVALERRPGGSARGFAPRLAL